jgi:16S rRNA (uracil1498-N3)-methyltransferase
VSAGPLRVPLAGLAEGRVALPEAAARYVLRVHRLAAGARFVAFDPERSVEADVELVAADRRGALVSVGPVRPAAVRARRGVTLIQGLGKGDKLDAVVRDATELGATRVVPALAERSVARPADGAARAERWRRVAIEAARQSGRGDAPAVEAPIELTEAIARFGRAEGAFGVCLDPGGATPLGRVLGELAAAAEAVIVVGPEGGLDDAELTAADAAGLARVSLGPFVLRTETVCAAVLGALLVAREA